MKKVTLICILFGIITTKGQIVPTNSSYNENIVWENVFTNGPEGKVNRGIVDSDGNCAVVFMPENTSRIHKINGENGALIWSITIENTIGFGISEIKENNRVDYLVSGGSGETQERWLCRLNGDNGSIIWDKTYTSSGSQYQFDGIRMTIIGSDGYIYGAGFIGGDEPGTIFIVYAGKAMLMKIDPASGDEIWTHENLNSEYALAVVESNDGSMYYGGILYDDNLKLTKVNTNGDEVWTRNLDNTENIIPADLTISSETIYYGCHTGREGAGDPFDYTCISLDTEANINWIKHYANPRGYSLEHIRNELYGIKANESSIYMFGGTGDESNYSAVNPPYESSDVWNGWVLQTDFNGDIIQSDVFCHDNVNTATEYGDLTEDGYVIFNDTDAQGDTEVGVIKVQINNNSNITKHPIILNKTIIKTINILGQEDRNNKNQIMFEIYNDGSVSKKFITD